MHNTKTLELTMASIRTAVAIASLGLALATYVELTKNEEEQSCGQDKDPDYIATQK